MVYMYAPRRGDTRNRIGSQCFACWLVCARGANQSEGDADGPLPDRIRRVRMPSTPCIAATGSGTGRTRKACLKERILTTVKQDVRLQHAARSSAAVDSRGSLHVCPPSATALRFSGNDRGFGNRMGWPLTAAAVAEALNAPVLWSYWPGANKIINGDVYDYREVTRLMHFPTRLAFVDQLVLDRVHVSGMEMTWTEAERETLARSAFFSELEHTLRRPRRRERVSVYPLPFSRHKTGA